jgi:ABC-type transporter Mla subunit MlaD
VARLTATCDRLNHSLDDAPKAADFQPLADHLYDFAQVAPRLLESLHELSEGLVATRSSFDDALLRMPRPEEYEPLAEPLRHFARVSPAMIDAVEDLERRVSPLATAAREIQGLLQSLHDAPRPSATSPPALARQRLEAVAAEVESARHKLEQALGTLPRGPEYAAVARQLRELASVSPSLLEWLEQVPTLSAPLAASTAGLQEAAVRLESAGESIAEVLRALWPESVAVAKSAEPR